MKHKVIFRVSKWIDKRHFIGMSYIKSERTFWEKILYLPLDFKRLLFRWNEIRKYKKKKNV